VIERKQSWFKGWNTHLVYKESWVQILVKPKEMAERAFTPDLHPSLFETHDSAQGIMI